jgi:Protein of unknown function (DUF2802)
MSIWILAGIALQIFVFLAVVIVWIRQSRPAKEDPRLSRGLQLLQSKISVLEDLSDRTETQVKQLTTILEERTKALQSKILTAEEMLMKIEHSMRKSLNVAEIFQDKIPHQEIIERNQTQKYVAAAKLAHDGVSIDEIVRQIGIPRSEAEFIAKVNRDELSFDPGQLPEWAKPRESDRSSAATTQAVERAFQSQASPDLSSLNRIQDDFKQSVREAENFERIEAERARQAELRMAAFKQTAKNVTSNVTRGIVNSAEAIVRQSGEVLKSATEKAEPVIRKVEFPRIFR